MLKKKKEIVIKVHKNIEIKIHDQTLTQIKLNKRKP